MISWIVFTLLILAIIHVSQMVGAMRVRKVVREEQADHAKCMALVAAYTGDQFAAQVLRAAANDWDSVEAEAHKQILQRKYVPDGPSVTTMWLNERAEAIEVMSRYRDKEVQVVTWNP